MCMILFKRIFFFTILSCLKLENIVNAGIQFRLHGSNTIGAVLAPALVEAFLRDELLEKNIN
jgi:hypothetical protein